MLGLMIVKKILVPISGAGVDEEVIELACDLGRKNKAEVRVVYIIRVERSLPLDATVERDAEKAEEILARAEETAAAANFQIDASLLQAREFGPTIVSEAEDKGIDLIVMGVGFKKRLGIFELGETISHVLKEAPCQVLLYRGPEGKQQ